MIVYFFLCVNLFKMAMLYMPFQRLISKGKYLYSTYVMLSFVLMESLTCRFIAGEAPPQAANGRPAISWDCDLIGYVDYV